MIRANALFIVIVIALVIGLLSSSLILLAYHQRIEILHNILMKKLDNNAASGINIALAEQGLLEYNEEKRIDLFGQESDSIILKKMTWGIYEVAVVRSFSGKNQLIKSAQYGYKPDSIGEASIYLVDAGRPVSICGKTLIKGTAYLPESGVKRAYIEGQSFTGFDLVKGKIKKSTSSLPALNKTITDNLVRNFELKPDSLTDKKVQSDILEEKDTIVQSFSDSTIYVVKKGPVKLEGKIIRGNVIIISDSIIRIESSAVLNDIILFAPAITIARGFKGNLQLFATDSISVAEECVLNYPSALGVFKKDFKVEQPFILIKKDAVVKGMLFTQQLVNDLRQTLVKLDNNAEVHGQVYVDGYAEVKGKIYGNITCNKFTLKTPSSIYENHLLNAVIDHSRLSKHYVGSSIVQSGKEKKIIKYLE